jgi:hypothetical protein
MGHVKQGIIKSPTQLQPARPNMIGQAETLEIAEQLNLDVDAIAQNIAARHSRRSGQKYGGSGARKPYRNYHPDEKILAVALNRAGFTCSHIGTALAIPENTVCCWCTDLYNIDTTKLRDYQDRILQNLPDLLIAKAKDALTRAFEPAKLDVANAYQLTIMASICIDKARLLSGQSTATIAHAQTAIDSQSDALAQLDRRIRDKETELRASGVIDAEFASSKPTKIDENQPKNDENNYVK